MGVVYKGRDPFIGRMVAIKTITTGLSDNPDLLQRFYREAQAAGGLQHPNIVTIFDAGEDGGTPYIAMEFLDGEDLAHVVAKEISGQSALPASLKLSYILQVCRALDYAHRRNIVHRDIKPGNIFITSDGTVKVVDFGIARLTNTSSTSSGMLIGTIDYMSPEQIRGEKVDGRSDIWAIGVMTYEILTYQKPFVGNNITAVMFSIVSSEPKPLRESRPDLPAELEAVLKKIFKKDANERYQTMEELLMELDPVYRRMQQEAVNNLILESEALRQSGNLRRAQELLKQVRSLDSSHTQAKSLLERVNAELRRSEILPKLNQSVENGEKLMQAGKFEEARQEIESALKIDSSFQPARELLAAVQKAAELNQSVQTGLRNTRQRLAEGSLTEAEQHVNQVLSLTPDNPEAQALRRQIFEEKERREKRRRVSEGMQRARQLWTAQQFDDAVIVLDQLQREFPSEAEISKLLEAVRADQAQQEVQRKMAEARKHLGAQAFSEALTILDELLARYPQETAAQKLRELVLQERSEHARRLQLQREMQALKKLVSEEKYQDVISTGEQILREFPEEFELARLVDFARSQKTQQEQQFRRQAKLRELQELIQASNLEKAESACEAALKEFPGDADMLRLLDLARTQQKDQKEKERRQLLEQRLRNISQSIERGDFSDAIDLGKRTMVQVGPDTDITKLLAKAERERAAREEKKEHNEQVQAAISMLESKQFDNATQVLRKVDETGVFDPRVPFLLRAAEEKRVPTKEDLTLVFSRSMVTAPMPPVSAPASPTPSASAETTVQAQPPVAAGEQKTAPMPPPGAAVTDQGTRLASPQSAAADVDVTKTWTKTQPFFTPPAPAEPGVADGTRVMPPADFEKTTKWQAPPEPQAPSPPAPADFSATSVMPPASVDMKTTPLEPPVAKPPREKERRKKKRETGWRPQPWSGEEFVTEPQPPRPPAMAQAPVAEPSAPALGASVVIPSHKVEEAIRQPASSATTIGQMPVAPPPPVWPPEPPVRERPVPERRERPPIEELPPPVPEAKPFWRTGPGMAIAGVVLAALIGGGIYIVWPRQDRQIVVPQDARLIEKQQQKLMEEAQTLAANQDYRGARAKLDEAEKLGGSLVSQIQELRKLVDEKEKGKPPEGKPPEELAADQVKEFIKAGQRLLGRGDWAGAKSEAEKAQAIIKSEKLSGPYQRQVDDIRKRADDALNNAALAALLQKEAQLWDAATAALQQNQFDQAESALNQILGLGEGGVHKADAQNELSRIPLYKKEEGLWPTAQAAAQQRGNRASRQNAVQLLNQVANLHGRREGDARRLVNDLAQYEAQIQGQISSLRDSARNDYRAGNFGVARDKASQIERLEGDASALRKEIDDAEKIAKGPGTIQPPPPATFSATCTVGQKAHSKYDRPVSPGSDMGQGFLDAPLTLTSGANCGFGQDLLQGVGKGKQIILLVNINETGAVTGGRVLSDDQNGGQTVLQGAQGGWKFNPPKVNGTAVKTSAAVTVRIS